MDLLETGIYLRGQLFEPLQALVTRWSYLGSLTTGGLFAEFKSSFWRFGKCWKRLSMAKTIFEKVAASRLISWEFPVIFENYTSNWLLTRAFYMLKTKQLFSFVYIATRRYLELLYLPYLFHWKLCCLLLFLENYEILEKIWQNRC